MKHLISLLVSALFVTAALIIPAAGITGCGGNDLNADGAEGGYTMPDDDFNYDQSWKEVRDFTSRGLPRSALETVDKIYKQAKTTNNAAEFIKALIHKIHFFQQVEEETFHKIHVQLLEELKQSRFPVTPVLHSMLAEQYWNYYRDNRYRFLKRSTTAEIKPEDMRTWNLETIVREIVGHYEKSLENADRSKQTRIDIYDKILSQGSSGRVYRPTLYDFLAHRAIDFFMDSESGLTQPVYRFSLNKEEYFRDTKLFAKMEITTRDNLSFHYHALKGLQELIRFHLDDKSPEALVDADLKRLRFLYRESVIDNKDAVYETALRRMMETYAGVPVTAEIYYELANLYFQWGEKYKPSGPGGETTHKYKWYKKKAHDLCKEAIAEYPGAVGASNCTYLLHKIESRILTVTQEQAVSPSRPFQALVHYQNQDHIHLKVVRTNREEMERTQRMRQDKIVSFFLAKPAVLQWETPLPEDGDFQDHTAEIKVDPVDTGEYVLLVSDSKDFNFKERAVSYGFFTATHIAFIHRPDPQNGLVFYLRQRESGRPLEGVDVQVKRRVYNRSSRKYVHEDGPRFRSNGDGYFQIPSSGRRESFQLAFSHGDDRWNPQQDFFVHSPHHPRTQHTRTFFFIDRGIYRPGQTLHFKGVMLESHPMEGEKNRILPNLNTTVTLYDVNHQQVGQLNLTSNEFGTFSGSFQLPVGRLNGNMRIGNGYGQADFSVEEYKRPKFEVLFDPLKKSYKLNDMVTLKGKAAAYAGYNIDGATVKYRVVRDVFYPYRWCCWGYAPPAPKMEILNGVTQTDAGGAFEVTFKAVPDLTLDKSTLPAFNFVVFAEVTDINGETQQASKGTAIGYTALKLDISLPGELDKDKKEYPLRLNSQTLSDDFIPAKGVVAVYRLKENPRICRTKLWGVPDRFTMDRKEYYKHFPHDNYAGEDNTHTWERQQQVFRASFDTGADRDLTLTGLGGWKPGRYVLEMTAEDRFGAPVKELKYFTLYSLKGKDVPFPRVDWLTIPTASAEPGETAVILVGSSARKVHVIYEVEHRYEIVKTEYFTLSNEQKKIELPILESYRGNVGVHLTFIKHNRVFKHSRVIPVPWSNKKLDIGFETFRDKLKPGEKEEWRIKIKAPEGAGAEPVEKAAAEMVATLYDASLDAFRPLRWAFDVYPGYYNRHQWQVNRYFSIARSRHIGILQQPAGFSHKNYDRLNWFGFYWRDMLRRPQRLKSESRGLAMTAEAAPPAPADAAMDRLMVPAGKTAAMPRQGKKRNGDKEMLSESLDDGAGSGLTPVGSGGPGVDLSKVKARTNLQETAFFQPHLRTGENGEVIIAFTVPEALTKWKMMGFAHTGDLKYGFASNELVTQKELMVVPNAPRFFREGDTLELSAKITNLSEKDLTGKARLMLFDSATMKPVDVNFKNTAVEKTFTAKAGRSDRAAWTIRVPDDVDTVTYRIVAQAGRFSDGEEKPAPVLKNRMMVTETLPLPVRGKQTKQFTLKKLVNAAKSSTLKHHKLTLEFTANPAWYAVQALPYLMEYPHQCMEQVFSRYYANGIASFIVNANPKIKRVFDTWKTAEDSNALLSNLEKNLELKTLLLEETPWVLNAQSETERKKRIALLFDIAKMAAQSERALEKLKEGQLPSGAWSWFSGMRENRYITQHIVCGLAHMGVLNVIDIRKEPTISAMLREAVPYLDRELKEDYDRLIRNDVNLERRNIHYIHVHYLYARSYLKHIPMDDACNTAFAYYKGQAEKYWLKFGKYLQGMIALAVHRYDNHKLAAAIITSIEEHALYSEEMGMYWKESYGHYWYQAPIETHALLIEAFDEIADDQKSVAEMKTWLLKQKQTQDWRTTKATAEACYALLLKGADWLAESEPPDIVMGKVNPVTIDPRKRDDVKVEAGTGYFKTSWAGGDVVPDMGHITVTNNNKMVAWGGLYWQYFENLDKITPAKTPLHIKKQLFVERPSDKGPVLHLLEKSKVKVGDRVKVRIELRVDRTMEYVHMKDMRASGFEPENVISRCKWQDGLGYYESTKDASTNFFFDYLPKGTYVFEYPLRVSHAGDFSNGITVIQSMYAPEFSSHSEGLRVKIEKK